MFLLYFYLLINWISNNFSGKLANSVRYLEIITQIHLLEVNSSQNYKKPKGGDLWTPRLFCGKQFSISALEFNNKTTNQVKKKQVFGLGYKIAEQVKKKASWFSLKNVVYI